jgi:hypothetical protein
METPAVVHAVTELAKTAPPITVTTLSMYQSDMSTMVYIITFIYTILMMYILIRDKLWEPYKRRNRIAALEADKASVVIGYTSMPIEIDDTVDTPLLLKEADKCIIIAK